jgi:hypothetical protein
MSLNRLFRSRIPELGREIIRRIWTCFAKAAFSSGISRFSPDPPERALEASPG